MLRTSIIAVAFCACAIGAFADDTQGMTHVSAPPSTKQAPGNQPSPSDVMATVDDFVITRGDLDVFESATNHHEMRDAMIQELIDMHLVDMEAARRGITVTGDDLQAGRSDILDEARPFGLIEIMRREDVGPAAFNDRLRMELQLERMAAPRKSAALAHVRQIFIRVYPPGPDGPGRPDGEALVIIREMQGHLQDGMEFGELARTYSDDSISKSRFGDFGVVYDGMDYDADFVSAALALKPGEITPEPVRSSLGYHLILCISTGLDHSKDEDRIFKRAERRYRHDQTDRFATVLLKQLRTKAHIVVN